MHYSQFMFDTLEKHIAEMRDIVSYLLVILALCAFTTIHVAARKRCGLVNGNAGEDSSRAGTSFYTGFMRRITQTSGTPTLLISSPYARVNLTVPHLSMFDVEYVVTGSKVITFPPDIKVITPGTITNKAIHITSDLPVSVYFINYRQGSSSDGGAVYPDESLGTEYIIAGGPVYKLSSVKDEFLIIGTKDNTSVTIELSSGSQETILINRMETYIRLDDEISGTMITATKPVAVKSGHECFAVFSSCDIISEQMPPIPSLGFVHVTGYMRPRATYFIQVLSPFDQTDVYVYDGNGTQLDVFLGLSRGSRNVGLYSATAMSIIATRPVLVAQYGYPNDGYGDASLMQVMSIDRFSSNYDFTVEAYDHASIIMIAISNDFDTAGLLLNGFPLVLFASESVSCNVPGNGIYEILYVNVNSQAHYILYHSGGNNVKFGVWLYGRLITGRAEYAWPLLSFFNQF